MENSNNVIETTGYTPDNNALLSEPKQFESFKEVSASIVLDYVFYKDNPEVMTKETMMETLFERLDKVYTRYFEEI